MEIFQYEFLMIVLKETNTVQKFYLKKNMNRSMPNEEKVHEMLLFTYGCSKSYFQVLYEKFDETAMTKITFTQILFLSSEFVN